MPAPQNGLSTRGRVLWTASNLCMLVGLVVLLYVGGLYATEEYNRYAARGDSDVPVPFQSDDGVSESAPFVPLPSGANTRSAEVPWIAGAVSERDEVIRQQRALRTTVVPSGQVLSPAPAAPPAPQQVLVSRLVIPSIKVNSKVIEVGWDVVEQNGQQAAVWQVAKYAVGQHRGSANPGEGDNIVMAGHVGGYGFVFRDLYYVRPGDKIFGSPSSSVQWKVWQDCYETNSLLSAR